MIPKRKKIDVVERVILSLSSMKGLHIKFPSHGRQNIHISLFYLAHSIIVVNSGEGSLSSQTNKLNVNISPPALVTLYSFFFLEYAPWLFGSSAPLRIQLL